MTRRTFLLATAAAPAGFAAVPVEHPIPQIRVALDRMYNCDFAASHRILDAFIATHPDQPLGPAFRASALLFAEMDRMKILEGEFLTSDDRIRSNKKIEADQALKQRFYESIDNAQRIAETRRAALPNDSSAWFALTMCEGMKTDYLAFIEKQRLKSLSFARKSQEYALELMKRDPSFVDAKVTAGISEYLIGSLPFFAKWFVKFPEVEGSKAKAIENLEAVSRNGYYMGPFARILLSIIHLREKRPEAARRMLQILTREFPSNALLKKEYELLRLKYPEPAVKPAA
jgi:hypothetical protein